MIAACTRRHLLFAAGALATLGSRAAHAADDRFALTGQPTQGGWLRGHLPPGASGLRLDDRDLAHAPDGVFLMAFDRDSPPQAVLSAQAAAGPISQIIAVAPRAWQIEHVNTPMHPPGMADAEFARRRSAELAQIGAARRHDTGAQGWRQMMMRPAHGPLSGRFGAQRVFRGVPAAYHGGLDLAAPAGSAILAPADGVVVLAAAGEPFTLEGHLVIVDHGMGLNSAMLHARALHVTEGTVLRQGDTIGEVGMTGRATGPHLHWALNWHGRKLDPLLFLAA